jgi:predicted YcjX-like family ATPase
MSIQKTITPNDALKLLEQRKYDKNHIPKPQQVFFKIDNKIIGLMQSFVVFSGLPKNGKSTFISAAIGSAFHNESLFKLNLCLPTERNEIALFDTESSEHDFYKNIDRIKKFANCNGILDKRFFAYSLREDEPTQIKAFIEAFLIAHKQCSCVIIDGLLDLILDFNSVIESRQLINWLKKITKKYNCMLVVVLHLGKKDLNTLGHLGSMCDRYANSVLKVEKNKERQTFELSSTLLRSDSDFDTISIAYSDDNGYNLVDTEPKQKARNYKDWNEQEHRTLCNKVIKEKGSKYMDLVEDIKEAATVGTNVSKYIIKHWNDNNIIFKRDGLYFYSVN